MRTVTLDYPYGVDLPSGMTMAQIGEMRSTFATYDMVRQIERWSIRQFMLENSDLLAGDVLDFGAGDEPYKAMVRGTYTPYKPEDAPFLTEQRHGAFDAIMCNQVMQYVSHPARALRDLYHALRPHGHLVMTFATNWAEVEVSDLHRHTAAGMRQLLVNAGFTVGKMERRAELAYGHFKFPLGYGIVARKVNL